MKRINKINYIILLLSAGVFLSCNDDFLNTNPLTQVPAEEIWKESALAEAYMYDIYFAFQDAGFSEETQASGCDEALFTHGGRGFKESNEGAYNETNVGWFGKTQSGHQWERLYRNIRSCNDFIENVDSAEFEEKYRIQLKGEAFFLRAYFYHRLTRGYGGVPLQLRVPQLGESDYSIARSSYTDCIKQVLGDIDSASYYLRERTFANTQKGRATLAACMALKTRVLTDAASDLHDEATATSRVSILAGYEHKELLFYTDGSREDRWKAAKEAADALMKNPMGHALSDYGGTGMTVEQKADAIHKFFLKESEESIFSRYFISTKDESGTKMHRFNGPCGYHCWSGNTPIQEFVNDFAMEDGSAFDWKNPAHAAAPYKQREPRFYASVMYDGMQWRPRPEDYIKMDPSSRIQTGYYQLDPAEDDIDKYWHGMDTRTGKGETWNGTYTGYQMKKFINPDLLFGDRGEVPWPFIRFTEIVMCYIEACIELGTATDIDEAKKYLSFMRERVGLPAVTTSDQDELRSIYRKERRLEMSFEEQRYWDIRRWMIANEQPGITGVSGINVIGKLKPGIPKQDVYAHDESKYTYIYTVIDLTSQEARQWRDKCYFLPILRDETNRNLKLFQNPGY